MQISDSNQSSVNQINQPKGPEPTKNTTGSLNGLTVSKAQAPAEQPALSSSTAKTGLNSVNSLTATASQSAIRTSLTRAASAPTALPDGQSDKSYDGTLIGANGKAYPPSTPLSQIPAVKPSNGQAPNETIIYVNGIRTDKSGEASSMQNIADKTGAQVIGVHNATESTFKDLVQSLGDKVDIGKNPAVDTIANAVYDSLKQGVPVHLMGHSQGGLILSRALTDVRKRLMAEDGLSSSQASKALSNVKVETFGGAAGSYPDGPQYVHYVNRADPVPGLLGLGSFKVPFSGDRKAGENAVVHRFTSFSDVHSLENTYLKERVPFDQARRNQF